VASPALWAGAVATFLAAAVVAWRVRAVAGFLAVGLSAGSIAATTMAGATASAALVVAMVFAAVSLGASAVGAIAGRLLDAEDHDPRTR